MCIKQAPTRPPQPVPTSVGGGSRRGGGEGCVGDSRTVAWTTSAWARRASLRHARRAWLLRLWRASAALARRLSRWRRGAGLVVEGEGAHLVRLQPHPPLPHLPHPHPSTRPSSPPPRPPLPSSPPAPLPSSPSPPLPSSPPPPLRSSPPAPFAAAGPNDPAARRHCRAACAALHRPCVCRAGPPVVALGCRARPGQPPTHHPSPPVASPHNSRLGRGGGWHTPRVPR